MPLAPPALKVQQFLLLASDAQSAAAWQRRAEPLSGQLVGIFVSQVLAQAAEPVLIGQVGGVPAPTLMVPQQTLPPPVQSSGPSQLIATPPSEHDAAQVKVGPEGSTQQIWLPVQVLEPQVTPAASNGAVSVPLPVSLLALSVPVVSVGVVESLPDESALPVSVTLESVGLAEAVGVAPPSLELEHATIEKEARITEK